MDEFQCLQPTKQAIHMLLRFPVPKSISAQVGYIVPKFLVKKLWNRIALADIMPFLKVFLIKRIPRGSASGVGFKR